MSKQLSGKMMIFGILLCFLFTGRIEWATQNLNNQEKSVKNISTAKKTRTTQLSALVYLNSLRNNQLSGYGIVIGLRGTGDSRTHLARKSMEDLLAGMGQRLRKDQLQRSRNVAAVWVTVDVPPFSQSGNRVDAMVSSIGDARSLVDGVLVQTPLYAGNGLIYGVAQGKLSDFKNGQTVAQLRRGVLMERNIETDIYENANNRQVRLTLKIFRLSTINRIEELLQNRYSEIPYRSQGSSLILDMKGIDNPKQLIGQLYSESISIPYRSQIIIDQRSGAILIADDLMIDPLTLIKANGESAIAREITGIYASLPAASTKENDNDSEDSNNGEVVPKKMRVVDLIKDMQKEGTGVENIIEILEVLRDNGSLEADIIIR